MSHSVRDAGQLVQIWDCPGRSGTVGTYGSGSWLSLGVQGTVASEHSCLTWLNIVLLGSTILGLKVVLMVFTMPQLCHPNPLKVTMGFRMSITYIIICTVCTYVYVIHIVWWGGV